VKDLAGVLGVALSNTKPSCLKSRASRYCRVHIWLEMFRELDIQDIRYSLFTNDLGERNYR